MTRKPTTPRIDWVPSFLLGGVFTIVLFVLLNAHAGGVCH